MKYYTFFKKGEYAELLWGNYYSQKNNLRNNIVITDIRIFAFFVVVVVCARTHTEYLLWIKNYFLEHEFNIHRII